MDVEDQETAIRSPYNPHALYFVQSPSATSHTTNLYHVFHQTESLPLHLPYSSSLGSSGSYLHKKKISYDAHAEENDDNRLIIHQDYKFHDDNSYYDDESGDEEEEKGLVRFLYFSTYPNSTLWICLQILWRFSVSMGVALLVFYIATKPPPPNVSLEIANIREFALGEGADATGVATKLLTLNCSMNLLINNKSNFFALHIQSPAIKMSFRHLSLATSSGPNNMCARSGGSTTFELIVATRNKPMYGGGIDMQDMLNVNKNLPLMVRLTMKSNFRIVWGLINSKFEYEADCLILVGRAYYKRRHTQMFKSRCRVLLN